MTFCVCWNIESYEESLEMSRVNYSRVWSLKIQVLVLEILRLNCYRAFDDKHSNTYANSKYRKCYYENND